MMKQAMLATAAVLALSDVVAQAVIVTGAGTAATPGRNTATPPASLAGTSAATQGLFAGFLGTPVSATWFLTANHIGNFTSGGRQIVMPDGSTHTTTGAVQRIGQTDILALQVSASQPFAASAIAPLYTSSDGPLTASDKLVIYGRGVQRGAMVTSNGTPNGYLWGGYDDTTNNTNLTSYGTNNYDTLRTTQPGEEGGFGAAAGTRFIQAAFNSGVDANEGIVALGDSGGGLFVNRGGVFKLVGLVNGVDAFYQNANGSGTVAAYDARGLYANNGTNYSLVAGGTAVPASSYFSYLPDNAAAIQAIVPEPTALAFATVAVAGLLRRRR